MESSDVAGTVQSVIGDVQGSHTDVPMRLEDSLSSLGGVEACTSSGSEGKVASLAASSESDVDTTTSESAHSGGPGITSEVPEGSESDSDTAGAAGGGGSERTVRHSGGRVGTTVAGRSDDKGGSDQLSDDDQSGDGPYWQEKKRRRPPLNFFHDQMSKRSKKVQRISLEMDITVPLGRVRVEVKGREIVFINTKTGKRERCALTPLKGMGSPMVYDLTGLGEADTGESSGADESNETAKDASEEEEGEDDE